MNLQLIEQFCHEWSQCYDCDGKIRVAMRHEAFGRLLTSLAEAHALRFVPGYDLATSRFPQTKVDGALLTPLGIPFGYWVIHPADENCYSPMSDAFVQSYPRGNTIFSDQYVGQLYQRDKVTDFCKLGDRDPLCRLLESFFRAAA